MQGIVDQSNYLLEAERLEHLPTCVKTQQT